jgi:hypothetical protein
MKVKFSVTFHCEYEIDPYDEAWMEEDDDGKYKWNEDYALELLRDQVADEPENFTGDYAESIDISELTVAKR